MRKIKNIAILGTGGVGGYFGGKLCHYLKNDPEIKIFFLARGRHLEEILKNGLNLKTDTDGNINCRPELASDNMDDFPAVDLALVCVKSYDLDKVTEKLGGKIHGQSVILPLLNGIDVTERIRKTIHEHAIFKGYAFIVTHIERPGTILQNGSFYKLAFSPAPGMNDRAQEISELLKRARINHQVLADVTGEIWEKFLFISPFGLVTAAHGKTFGQIMESEALTDQVKSVMHEIFKISEIMRIPLSPDSPEKAFEKGRGLPYETKTSFQRDFEIRDRQDERDLFGGAILRLGKKYSIETPVTQKLYDILNETKPSAGLK